MLKYFLYETYMLSTMCLNDRLSVLYVELSWNYFRKILQLGETTFSVHFNAINTVFEYIFQTQ